MVAFCNDHIRDAGDIGCVLRSLGTDPDRIVLAREGQFLGCSFHPELTEDTRIMKYFIEMVREHNSVCSV